MRLLAFPMRLVSDYTATDFRRQYVTDAMHVLDAGCGPNPPRILGTTTLDIAPSRGVDIVANLDDTICRACGAEGVFDVILCNAALQYMEHPVLTLCYLHEVLTPNGLLYLDVPFIQPYCAHGPDRWRFSAHALRTLMDDGGFDILAIRPTIRAGSALWMYAVHIAGDLTTSRLVNAILWRMTYLALYPLRWLKAQTTPDHTAGGFCCIARKRA